MPEEHDRAPALFLIPVEVHPGGLRIAGTTERILQRRIDEPEMIVRGGIDQVAQFLLWRP